MFIFHYIFVHFHYKPVLVVIKLFGSGCNFPDFKVPEVSD